MLFAIVTVKQQESNCLLVLRRVSIFSDQIVSGNWSGNLSEKCIADICLNI